MNFNEQETDSKIYQERRKNLIQSLKRVYPKFSGALLLTANFEQDSAAFKQESTFFYLTGIKEPGIAVIVDMTEHTTVFAPQFKGQRAQWVSSVLDKNDSHTRKTLGIDEIAPMGEAVAGYDIKPYAPIEVYNHLIKKLQGYEKIFTLCPSDSYQYVMQRFLLSRLCTQAPDIIAKIVDISPLIAQMRRSKDMHEIEAIAHAIEITHMAHEIAIEAIDNGVGESEVQGALEYAMIAAQARPAFPSIVAAGKNGTVLHYHDSKDMMQDGELVVIDIGAQAEGYCADITRTYPVSGKFTERQKELYQLVLDTQEHIAQLAAPGMWLNNAEQPHQSLQHLAKKYLAEHGGYDLYFVHGIGHFLGLDVHDVGDSKVPLQEGDVITIEPGIYIPEESIGIRIEDNYWIVKGGAVCLSETICKAVDAIEYFMEYGYQKTSLESDDEFESDDYFDENDVNVH